VQKEIEENHREVGEIREIAISNHREVGETDDANPPTSPTSL